MKLLLPVLVALAMPLHGATYNVRDLGAVGDGQTFDTVAIQKALDACAPAGGTVEFPAGIYLSRPLKLHSWTTVQIDAGAVLQASSNQMDFMKTPGDWLRARSGDFIPLLSGRDLTNVTLTGGGVIDGHGSVWWGAAENARLVTPGYTLPRPNLISLDHCQRVRVENLTLQNSPKYHLVPSDCDDLVISNVTILAPEHAANTDAIDPSGRRILITHCTLDVGDDNVAIKGGGVSNDTRPFASEDITVSHCTFRHGHGMSIGSETSGGVRNVVVRDCSFTDTENGLRIKSDERRGGLVENITYENITMTNVAPAITLTCVYQQNSSGDARSSAPARTGGGGGKIPVFRNIRFLNLTATCPKAAGQILGLPDSCIADVLLENVHITATTSFEITNAKKIRLKYVSVTVPAGQPFRLENAEVSGLPGK